METVLAVATILLAIATFAMAAYTARMATHTQRLADESEKSSYRQIGVQTWLELSRRFDSRIILNERSILAGFMISCGCNPVGDIHKQIREVVPNLFEDVGALYFGNYIDKQLAEDTFGFYASLWWEVLKKYIADERALQADPVIFKNFERFVGIVKNANNKIDLLNIQRFLADELRLDNQISTPGFYKGG